MTPLTYAVEGVITVLTRPCPPQYHSVMAETVKTTSEPEIMCSWCKVMHPVSHFYPATTTRKRKYQSRCKTGTLEYAKLRRKIRRKNIQRSRELGLA